MGQSMKTKIRIAIRVVLYIIIFLLIYGAVSSVFLIDAPEDKEVFAEFYNEPPMTHDAIYIGPSSVYWYFSPPYAFHKYGITVFSMSLSGMSHLPVLSMIEECLKTQNPSYFIVDIRRFAQDNADNLEQAHRATHFMKPSKTKYGLLDTFFKQHNLSFKDRLEFFFPIIKFHSRWTELKESDFTVPDKAAFKGRTAIPISKTQGLVPEFTEDVSDKLPSSNEIHLRNLLQYCKSNNINVIFVSSPFMENGELQKTINYVGKIINEYGFDFYNFNNDKDFYNMGFSLEQDFANATHTNIHGQIKFTDYLGRILKEHYKMPDRRNDPTYLSWHEAYREFSNEVKNKSKLAWNAMES